jgi:hypothetical protein
MILPILLSIYQIPMTCVAVDGDTLKCPEIGRVRLLGIDAPEMPGHCRKGRGCAPGDPQKSKAHLAKLIRGNVVISPVTRDRYGRTVAQAYSGGRTLPANSCGRGWRCTCALGTTAGGCRRSARRRTPLDRLSAAAEHACMTDDEIEAELATLTDDAVLAIWLNAADHEHPTRREEIALGEMERRNIDF